MLRRTSSFLRPAPAGKCQPLTCRTARSPAKRKRGRAAHASRGTAIRPDCPRIIRNSAPRIALSMPRATTPRATPSSSSALRAASPSGRWRQRTLTDSAASLSSPSVAEEAGRGSRANPVGRRRDRLVDACRGRPCGVAVGRRLGQELGAHPGEYRRVASTSPTRGCASLVRVCRVTRVTCSASRSRGPTSTRTGTPLSSQSTERRPNPVSVRSSSRTRSREPSRSATIWVAAAAHRLARRAPSARPPPRARGRGAGAVRSRRRGP